MSDKATQREAAAATAEADKHHLAQARSLVEQLTFTDLPFEISNGERLEMRHHEAHAGIGATILRHRRNNRLTDNREDVYFSLTDGQDVEALAVFNDDLATESSWVESGEFEKIAPHRDALFAGVAEGVYREVRMGGHEDLREFLRLVHEAISIQRQPTTA